jgi:hypothetical protein
MEWSAMQGLKEIDTEMTKSLNPDIRFFQRHQIDCRLPPG